MPEFLARSLMPVPAADLYAHFGLTPARVAGEVQRLVRAARGQRAADEAELAA